MRDRLLGICLVVLIIVFIVQHKYFAYKTSIAEGFKTTIPNLKTCPSNTKEFNTVNSVDCCEGNIEGKSCTGKVVCTLSERSGDLPRCVDYVASRSIGKGLTACPMSMPNYFEKDGKAYCTKGALNRQKNGPVNNSEKTCAILSNQEERQKDPNSCYNQKLMEEMKFTIANVPYDKFSWIGSSPSGPGKVVVYGATYELDGRVNTCYDRASIERRADVMTPGWRSDPFEAERINKTNFCN